jgi:hypothetical protein
VTRELLETATEGTGTGLTREPVSEKTAAEHDKILARLRALLVRRGLHARVVEWLKLTLHTGGARGLSSSRLERYTPELIVFAPEGRRVATVRMAVQAEAYIVDVAQVGEDNEMRPDKRYVIPSGHPAKVAAVIPGYLPDTP